MYICNHSCFYAPELATTMTGGIMISCFSICLSVLYFWTRFLRNTIEEFRPLGLKDELIKFWWPHYKVTVTSCVPSLGTWYLRGHLEGDFFKASKLFWSKFKEWRSVSPHIHPILVNVILWEQFEGIFSKISTNVHLVPKRKPIRFWWSKVRINVTCAHSITSGIKVNLD